jgi:hypothetical protein
MTMTHLTKKLAPALVVAAIPLFAGSASAAPLSQSLTLGNTETATVTQVQYRRWRYYDNGYYAYGAAPGYIVRPRPRPWNYGNGGAATGPGSARICPADRYQTGGFPSWMCR